MAFRMSNNARRRLRNEHLLCPPPSCTSRPSPIARNSSRRGVFVECVRDLALYSRLVSGTIPTIERWLDKLWAFGTIAMKLFLLIIGEEEDPVNGSTLFSAYCSGVSQSIFIGAEDLLYSSALMKRVSIDSKSEVLVPCIDYRQAIVRSVSATFTSGSPTSSRAGRIAAAILNVTQEELEDYKPIADGEPWRQPDSWSFSQVSQMPGSVTAPYGSSFTVSWLATADTYSRRALALGQRSLKGFDLMKNLTGGKPVCRVVVAYQDLATNDGSVFHAYAPREFILQVQIHGEIELLEPGRVFIRSAPIVTEDALIVGLATKTTCGAFKYELPIGSVIQHEGSIYISENDFELAIKCLPSPSMVVE